MKALLLLAGAASGMINSGTPDGVPASFEADSWRADPSIYGL